jgi:hypothetical protein
MRRSIVALETVRTLAHMLFASFYKLIQRPAAGGGWSDVRLAALYP